MYLSLAYLFGGKMLLKSNMIKVVSFTPHSIAGKILNILPGINEIKGENWEWIKKDSYTQRFLNEKKFEIIDDEGSSDDSNDNNNNNYPLANKNAKQAIAIVKETMDIELLNNWKNKEERSSIIQAIDKQLKDLIYDAEEEK
jgi:hypothetical protein